MDDLVQWLGEQLDVDERVARMASGSTFDGGPGNLAPVPTGDEWEAFEGEVEAELLVALRPNLPRPPDVMSGMWGAWISQSPDPADPEAGSPMPALVHAALHDPARVLREIDAKREILATVQLHLDAATSTDSQLSGPAKTGLVALRPVVKALASPYAERPGFLNEWRS
ncbi:DUF6221 family protein [Streptomyces sp. NPDC102340]|uniref:DUF6221 family protein n=1 Tax=unclassified Streptomyces TaxID=2593676 RepID=UPI00382D807B